jgi:hypothetical protein
VEGISSMPRKSSHENPPTNNHRIRLFHDSRKIVAIVTMDNPARVPALGLAYLESTPYSDVKIRRRSLGKSKLRWCYTSVSAYFLPHRVRTL